jgi:hypothetical protein
VAHLADEEGIGPHGIGDVGAQGFRERGQAKASLPVLDEETLAAERPQEAIEGGGMHGSALGEFGAAFWAAGEQVGEAERGRHMDHLGQAIAVNQLQQRGRRCACGGHGCSSQSWFLNQSYMRMVVAVIAHPQDGHRRTPGSCAFVVAAVLATPVVPRFLRRLQRGEGGLLAEGPVARQQRVQALG